MFSNIIKIISLAALAVLINLFLTYWSNTHNSDNDILVHDSITYDSVVAQIDTGFTQNYIEPPEITAKVGCVFDLLKNEYVYKKNADTQLSLASITKLMTAVVAKENLLDTTLIKITKESLMQEGDSGLYLGELWKLKDIINIMLVESINDAAYAIASSLRSGLNSDDVLYVNLMNNKANKLGLNQTYYLNATGLDINKNTAGALGSCKDTVELVRYIMANHPSIIAATSNETLSYNGRNFKNTNKLLAELPSVYGGKTGFSDISGGNLLVLVDKGVNHPMIITVLGSTLEGRFEDTKELYRTYVNGF